jgi:hypothetical protein
MFTCERQDCDAWVQSKSKSQGNFWRSFVLIEKGRSYFLSRYPLHAGLHTNSGRSMKMFPTKRVLASALLAGSLLIAVGSSGCAARVRVYDEDHRDYHSWNHDEDVVYRGYWTERKEPYRDYKKLNKDEQKDYWNWRHNHPDNH